MSVTTAESGQRQVVPLSKLVNEELMTKFKGEKIGFVQVGPEKWLLPAMYTESAHEIVNIKVRPNDVWLLGMPRSGTTLTEELIWLIKNDLDFETARAKSLQERFLFIDGVFTLSKQRMIELTKEASYRALTQGSLFIGPDRLLALAKEILSVKDLISSTVLDKLAAQSTDEVRFVKSHLPFNLLPHELSSTSAKIIYLARNPKDVAVSYYHLTRSIKAYDFKDSFPTFWKYFKNGHVIYTPYWEHIKQGWQRRNEPNVLFLFYEDFVKDPANYIGKLANFLDKPLSHSQIEQLINHVEISNFRRNVPVFHNLMNAADPELFRNTKEAEFIRQGGIGKNKEFHQHGLEKDAEVWIQYHISSIPGLTFPGPNY